MSEFGTLIYADDESAHASSTSVLRKKKLLKKFIMLFHDMTHLMKQLKL